MAVTLGTTDREALSLQQQIRLTQAQQVKTELAKTQVQRMRADADLKVLKEREARFPNVTAPADEVELMVSADPIGRWLLDDIAAMNFSNEQGGSLRIPRTLLDHPPMRRSAGADRWSRNCRIDCSASETRWP